MPTINNNDYQAIQDGTTFCRIDNYGLIKIAGPDATKFLQGQLTCDLDKINQNQTALGGYANLQGRLVASFRVYQVKDMYFLRMVSDALEPCLAQLNKYAVFSKVELSIDDQHDLFGIAGPDCVAVANKAFGAAPEQFNQQLFLGDACLANIGEDQQRIECLVAKSNSASIASKLAETSTLVSSQLWRLLDINSGIANVYTETAETLLPHDVSFQEVNGLSFDKGCYLGQEVIARMHYRGKLKKRLYQVEFTSAAEFTLGESITSANGDRNIGSLVDYVRIAENETFSLMILPIDLTNLMPIQMAEHSLEILNIT